MHHKPSQCIFIFLFLILMLFVSPVAAIPNLLNQSNQLWVWSDGGVTLAPNMTTNYDNSQRAWRINETTSGGNHYLSKAGGVNTVAGANYTWSLYAKQGSVKYIQLAFGSTAFGTTNYTNFDLDTCSITATGPTLSSAESAPNGWCRLRATTKAIAAGSSTAAIFGIRGPKETRAPVYTGNINNYSYICCGQLTLGDTMGTYNATFQPPEANFTASAYSGASPLSVTLYDNTTPSEIVGWNWYAINTSNSSQEYAIETTQNPTHIFGDGNWTVKLKASNYLYSGNSSSKWINVSYNPPPIAAFSANNLSFCQGTNTQFTDESTNSPTGWAWTFGDGNTSTNQNPLKTYDVLGSMTVKLTASNSYGSDDEEKVGYITVNYCAPPTPTPTPTPTPAPAPFYSDFVSNVTCGNAPFNVTFTDTSVGEGITTWTWDFGDDNTSILEDDTNQYSQTGLFTVRHYIGDGLGNYSWKNETDIIKSYPDWIPCSSGYSGGNNRVDVETDLPLPIYIPILSAGLALVAWRRKFRM